MQLTSPMPPSIYVHQKIGAQLDSLGAKLVDKGLTGVEARLPDPKNVELANAAFRDAIEGVSITWRDKDGNGVRGFASDYAIADGIGKLAGVTSVAAMETSPLQIRVSATADAKDALNALLRERAPGGESIGVQVAEPATP